jgi:hypothetical protein
VVPSSIAGSGDYPQNVLRIRIRGIAPIDKFQDVNPTLRALYFRYGRLLGLKPLGHIDLRQACRFTNCAQLLYESLVPAGEDALHPPLSKA